MKIAFWLDYDHTYTFVKLYHAVAKLMPVSGATGIVVGDRYIADAAKSLPAGTRLLSFYELVEGAKTFTPSASEIAEFKELDNKHKLSRVAYSDRFIADFKYDELLHLFIYLIRHFREYIRAEKPDVFFFPCIASQFSHLAYLLAREEGVRIVTIYGFGVEDLHAVLDNPYLDSPETVSSFNAMGAGVNPPTEEETDWAKAFMAKIRAGSAPYPNAGQIIEDRKFQLPTVAQGLKYLKNYTLYYRNDFTLPSPMERLKQVFRLRRNRQKGNRYFTPAEQIEGDFILFPLHFEPEIATLFLTQYEQLSFIDIIARQLPLSCRLVVKEHPGMLGQRDWRFFDSVTKRYPNIVFVDPRAGTGHLIKRARAVVSLSGTVIMEALIHGKPIIYTSRSRFGGFALGHFTQDIVNFGGAIETAESKIASDDDIIRMLVAIRRSCRRYVFAEPFATAGTLDDANLDKIAAHVSDHLLASQ